MRLKSLYPLTNGIFADLQELDVPWKNDDIATELDVAYIGQRSGNKETSCLVDNFIDDGELSAASRATIASTIFAVYGKNWDELFKTLEYQYNPIENYDMTETHTGTDTGLKTPTGWIETVEHSVSQDYKVTESQKPNQWKETVEHSVSQDYKETESQKPNQWKETVDHKVSQDYKETDSEKPNQWKETKQTDGNEGDNTDTTTSKIMPFNGSDFADISQSTLDKSFREKTERSGTYDREHTQTGTKTEEKTQSGTFDTERTQAGTKTDETTHSGTYDTERTQTGTKTDATIQSGTFDTERTQTGKAIDTTTQAGTFEDKTTYNTTLKRHGNIGVTSAMQLVEQQRKVWLWNIFIQVIFPDLDRMLTIPIY